MKKGILTICILSAILLNTGCGTTFQPSISSVYVEKNGKITEAVIESFEKDYYSFEELKAEVEKEISTYNQGSDRDKITIKSLEQKEQTVYLMLEYEDAASYGDYQGTYCFTGSIGDALQEGLAFDMVFKDAEYQEYGAKEVTAHGSDRVVVLRSEGVVQTEKPIKYVSNNVEILGSHMAEVMPIDDEAEYAYIIY